MDLETLTIADPWEWPGEAPKYLSSVLRAGSAAESERSQAARLAGNIATITDDLADALLEIAANRCEPEQLRATAAIALGPVLEQMDTELDMLVVGEEDDMPISQETIVRIRRTFHQLYMDPDVPKLVRRRVLESSIRSPADWHEGAVRAAYHADDVEWQVTGIFAMGRIGDFDQEIIDALESEDERIRFEAVRAAGTKGIERAWPQIRSILIREHGHRDLLLAAIIAAPTVNPAEAAEPLSLLTGFGDPEIAEAAEEAIAAAEVFGRLDMDADFDDDF